MKNEISSKQEACYERVDGQLTPEPEPWYEADDGPLTDEQLDAISKANPLKDVSEDEVINRLF